MPKVTESYCPICKKKYRGSKLIEITTDPMCPDCGKCSLEDWGRDEITCENEACYTSESVLLVREDVHKAQKQADKLSEKIGVEKDAGKRTKLMEKQRGILNDIKDNLRMGDNEKPDEFMARMETAKYVCSDCGKSLSIAEWKAKGYVCPKCKVSQLVTVTRDKTVFIPRQSKHLTVVCPKYHVIARVRRD